MIVALTFLYIAAISYVGAFAADRLEPNRRLALVFKCVNRWRSGDRQSAVALRSAATRRFKIHLPRRSPTKPCHGDPSHFGQRVCTKRA
jgi:hypothetical protein